ncbi:hypothetical protein K491DRAFT_90773 [Lophiostoma macrostomum CBS 122681]|uniref:Uncharacterized protein n=1 Tax=Lophiostoma macrostomum CBS 122681 TaxID=1314788 RepID=A0A6A6SUJ5_9PLEO|nr:hypothetical protein K491DRAFT_90773 [Lophiostoma macrostomum CBS 122681]
MHTLAAPIPTDTNTKYKQVSRLQLDQGKGVQSRAHTKAKSQKSKMPPLPPTRQNKRQTQISRKAQNVGKNQPLPRRRPGRSDQRTTDMLLLAWAQPCPCTWQLSRPVIEENPFAQTQNTHTALSLVQSITEKRNNQSTRYADPRSEVKKFSRLPRGSGGSS